MKPFLYLPIILLLLSHIKDANGQQEEVERRLWNFINESLINFPMWLKDNRLLPDRLHGNSNLTMDTTLKTDYGKPEDPPLQFLNLNGILKDRFYYGGDNNVTVSNFHFNLTTLRFTADLTYGNENDYFEGNYQVTSSYFGSIPVSGTGTFRKTNPIESPQRRDQVGTLEANNEGYFFLRACYGTVHRPIFANLTLNGLEGGSLAKEVTEIIKSWYHTQFSLYDFPNIGPHWCDYMYQRFLKRKIVDIIGIELPPTLNFKKSEMPPTYTRKPYFDHEKEQWALKTTVTY